MQISCKLFLPVQRKNPSVFDYVIDCQFLSQEFLYTLCSHYMDATSQRVDQALDSCNKIVIFFFKYFKSFNLYPNLTKSPKSCLNFLHNFSSVCESLLRLICLNKLGPKRNGRSELCWEP